LAGKADALLGDPPNVKAFIGNNPIKEQFFAIKAYNTAYKQNKR